MGREQWRDPRRTPDSELTHRGSWKTDSTNGTRSILHRRSRMGTDRTGAVAGSVPGNTAGTVAPYTRRPTSASTVARSSGFQSGSPILSLLSPRWDRLSSTS